MLKKIKKRKGYCYISSIGCAAIKKCWTVKKTREETGGNVFE